MLASTAGKTHMLTKLISLNIGKKQLPALVRFNSTLQLPDLTQEQAGRHASSDSVRPIKFYHTKLAKNMLLFTKQKIPSGLNTMSNVFKEMEAKGVSYNLDTWVYKLQFYALRKDNRRMLKTFDTILERYTPSVDVFNIVTKALSNQGNVLEQSTIMEIMKAKGIQPNAFTYYNVIKTLHESRHIEQALDLHDQALQEGIRPNALSYDHLVRLCGEFDELELGWKMLQDADKANLPLRLAPGIALPLLRSAVKNENLEVVNGILEIIQRRNLSLPDDGTALAVLNFAGNIGNTELASSMIDSLGQQGYQYHEQHFAPLIQAFVKQGDIQKAFSVLEIMRSFSIPATKHTAHPILESLDGNVEQIDQAYYILEQMKKEGKEVDTIAFNTVLGACVKARDLHRSISTYQEAAKLGVKPNIDTYNYALDACLLARNRQMGDLILNHMKEANVSPNIATYTKCIMLSCTQSNYEDAFLYLEEMKQYNIIPPRMCYEHLVRKLVRESDPRLKVALEEMETFGLEVTPFLRSYITNKGRPQQQSSNKPSTKS
ncbi:hypothetical protein BC943DRAFT_334040 [Umbelopsis sp. AD052]|nr:hypothetical protein BC943DRAFT_334040 [Umbelopsis sp. AD052]